ncbi:hypothetical protein PI124_g4030 [Phytophthora idaei]|nr:hypothetical protein PI125_g4317 [Phytophthora idaei]KAG3166684.1 hypothetical protein PI126_g4115 [Phytophthora idaei]KAG3251385.1 hypothetical protein PI124_g4030 [Phytophthora idaei]
MQKSWTMKGLAAMGAKAVEGLRTLQTERQQVEKVLPRILQANPYEVVDTDLHPDLYYSTLYRLQPQEWISGEIFTAVKKVWSRTHSAKVEMTSEFKLNKKLKVVDLPSDLLIQLQTAGTKLVFLPLNFERTHWTAIAIDTSTKSIFVYDPLGV